LLKAIKSMTKIKSPVFIPEINLYSVMPDDFEYPFEPTEFNCMYGYPTWAGIALSRYVLDNSDKFKSISITDIGCGSGIATIAAIKAGANVTSIDRDVASLYFTEQNCILNDLNTNLIWGSFKDIQTEYVMFSSLSYDKENLENINRLISDKKVIIGSLQPKLSFSYYQDLNCIKVNTEKDLFIFSNFIGSDVFVEKLVI